MVVKYQNESGMTVLLEPIEGVVSISVGLWVKTGSRNESTPEMGYAHFIEHMLFKGTSNHTAKDIARIVDRVGGQHNAATNREYTCYYINVESDYLEMSINLLADMYFNSLFDGTDIEKEKNVILEELKMYDDTPDELIHDVFMECMLSQHPLGHSILGTEESLNGTSREKLLSFLNRHYRNENCIFVIAGNFRIEEARSLLDCHFSKKHHAVQAANSVSVPVPQRVFRKHLTRDLEQVHFCLGVEGLKRNDDDRWALFLLSTILGGSMSSRLFQNIRENEGLCYSIFSFHSSYTECGVFGIYCGTSPENYSRARDLIIRECEQMLREGVSAEELADAKTFLKGNLALSLESTEVRMSHLAKNEMIFGRNYSFEEVVSRINMISLDDFNRVCSSLFSRKRMTLVSIGKVSDSADKVISLGT